MNVLILANLFAVASGRYVYDALKRLGHDARSVGPEMGAQIWGIEVDPQFIWTPDPPPDGWKPDLMLVMDSAIDAQKKDTRAPLVVYGVDNHVRDYRGVVGADHLFLAHGHGARIGEPNVTWLPCGYDPTLCVPGPAWATRPMDGALLGVIYPQRGELLYSLFAHVPGFKAVYGAGVYDEYRDAYHSAKLSLVRSAHQDVAQRVWETAAMGCLVLMDDSPDCAPLGLVDNENCLIYRSVMEACEKARWALEHPEDAARIAAAGQAWAQPGTWDARAQVILDWVAGQEKPLTARKRQKAAQT
jgi:hypothetical protein